MIWKITNAAFVGGVQRGKSLLSVERASAPLATLTASCSCKKWQAILGAFSCHLQLGLKDGGGSSEPAQLKLSMQEPKKVAKQGTKHMSSSR